MKHLLLTSMLLVPFAATLANATENENIAAEDMSDPLAVYTQAGVGATNKGLNFKFGQAYDTGKANTKGMNVLEIKGVAGEALGWDGSSARNDSVDGVRFRHFEVNSQSGLGSQLDVDWDFNQHGGTISYSLIQALPAWGRLQLYPLAGMGFTLVEDPTENNLGYFLPSSFAVAGMYSKLTLTDNLWLNYNPMYIKHLGGNEAILGNSQLKHELALSYQLNPRQNLRAFVNWNRDQSFENGDFRIEFNHQF